MTSYPRDAKNTRSEASVFQTMSNSFHWPGKYFPVMEQEDQGERKIVKSLELAGIEK